MTDTNFERVLVEVNTVHDRRGDHFGTKTNDLLRILVLEVAGLRDDLQNPGAGVESSVVNWEARCECGHARQFHSDVGCKASAACPCTRDVFSPKWEAA